MIKINNIIKPANQPKLMIFFGYFLGSEFKKATRQFLMKQKIVHYQTKVGIWPKCSIAELSLNGVLVSCFYEIFFSINFFPYRHVSKISNAFFFNVWYNFKPFHMLIF